MPCTYRYWMHGNENITTSAINHSTSSSCDAQPNYSANLGYCHNVIRLGYYLDNSRSDNFAGVRLTAPTRGDFGYMAEKLCFCYYNPGPTLYLTVGGNVRTQTVVLETCSNNKWKAIQLEGQNPLPNGSETHSGVEYVDLTVRGSKSGRLSKCLSGSVYFADFIFSNAYNFSVENVMKYH